MDSSIEVEQKNFLSSQNDEVIGMGLYGTILMKL